MIALLALCAVTLVATCGLAAHFWFIAGKATRAADRWRRKYERLQDELGDAEEKVDRLRARLLAERQENAVLAESIRRLKSALAEECGWRKNGCVSTPGPTKTSVVEMVYVNVPGPIQYIEKVVRFSDKQPRFVCVDEPVEDQYRHANWQKLRLWVMDRDGFRCRNCGNDQEELHVHHLNTSRHMEK